MAISNIDLEKCVGCGTCVKTCPADVFRLDPAARKSVITYPEDCSICRWCMRECPVGAISVTPEKTAPFLTSVG